MSNEPFNVTVKDQLEKNIEKYEKLNEVITQKEDLVSEVIQHGKELADRAKTKQERSNHLSNKYLLVSCYSTD